LGLVRRLLPLLLLLWPRRRAAAAATWAYAGAVVEEVEEVDAGAGGIPPPLEPSWGRGAAVVADVVEPSLLPITTSTTASTTTSSTTRTRRKRPPKPPPLPPMPGCQIRPFPCKQLRQGARQICEGLSSAFGVISFKAKVEHHSAFRVNVHSELPLPPESINLVTRIGQTSHSEVTGRAASLMCFNSGAEERLLITAITETGPGHVRLTVERDLAVRMSNANGAVEMSVEGSLSANIVAFNIRKKEHLHRFSFETKEDGTGFLRAHIFRQTHRCVSELFHGGCVEAQDLVECLSNAPLGVSTGATITSDPNQMPAYTFTLSRKAKLPLLRAYPYITEGLWFVVLSCGGHGKVDCNRTASVSLVEEPGAPETLALGALFMAVVPFTAFVAIACLKLQLNRWSGWFEEVPFPRIGCSEIFKQILSYGWKEVQSLTVPTSTRMHAKTLCLISSAYFTSTLQFAITRWHLMIRSGNRDVCYYNEACFIPFLNFDLPFNKMLSHIPYFVCSVIIFVAILYAEVKWRNLTLELSGGAVGPPPLDLSVFYALSLAIALEGLGSMCYHLCPSLEVFQFDTAFMITIAHLSMFALLQAPVPTPKHSGLGSSILELRQLPERPKSPEIPNGLDGSFGKDGPVGPESVGGTGWATAWDFPTRAPHLLAEAPHLVSKGSAVNSRGSGSRASGSRATSSAVRDTLAESSVLPQHQKPIPTSYQYFLFIVCPSWMFNFVGTWFDVKLIRLNGKRYFTFLISVGIWSLWVIGHLPRFFPPRVSSWTYRVLQFLLTSVLLLNLALVEVRRSLGGTANLFLLMSIFTMFWVVFVQVVALELPSTMRRARFASCTARLSAGVQLGLKLTARYSLEALLFVCGNLAVQAFTTHATDVLKSPAESRDLNKACIIAGAFDTHDLWHLLSAIALSLWVLSLLNTRVRAWWRAARGSPPSLA